MDFRRRVFTEAAPGQQVAGNVRPDVFYQDEGGEPNALD